MTAPVEEADAIRRLEQIRWEGKPECPYCQSKKVSRYRSKDRSDGWQCKACTRSFTVTVGTMFHGTRSLAMWFNFLALVKQHPGASVAYLARELGITWKTADTMKKKLKETNNGLW